MNRAVLNSLFTKESLASLQGSALLTLLVPNVLTYLIGSGFAPYEKWVAFVVALLSAFFIAFQAPEKGATKWILALLNSFLIFASAVGATEVLGSGVDTGMAASGETLPFFHSWTP
jgi:hypothetical protein